MSKRLYLVKRLIKTLDVETLFGQQEMSLKCEDGMIGMLPVYRSRKEAEKANPGCGISIIETISKEDEVNYE